MLRGNFTMNRETKPKTPKPQNPKNPGSCLTVKPLPSWLNLFFKGFADSKTIWLNSILPQDEKVSVPHHELLHAERLASSRLKRFLLNWKVLSLSFFSTITLGLVKPLCFLIKLTSVPLFVYLIEEFQVLRLNGEKRHAVIQLVLIILYSLFILFKSFTR